MSDVFPLRNLPTDAEEWGRTVEDRIYQAENALSGSKQSLLGLNRATGSTLENLAYQISEVQRLYNLIPVAYQRTSSVSNFAVPSSGAWNTLATVSFSLYDPGTLSLTAEGAGQLVSGGTSTLMTASYRLTITSGSASTVVPGLFASPSGTFVNNFKVTWGWSVPVTVGANITVTLQCRPDDGTSWPARTGSYAVLTVFGTFTRG